MRPPSKPDPNHLRQCSTYRPISLSSCQYYATVRINALEPRVSLTSSTLIKLQRSPAEHTSLQLDLPHLFISPSQPLLIIPNGLDCCFQPEPSLRFRLYTVQRKPRGLLQTCSSANQLTPPNFSRSQYVFQTRCTHGSYLTLCIILL